MKYRKVLKRAENLVTPTKHEAAKVELAAMTVLKKLNRELSKKRLRAKAVAGGSFAKGTWLPDSTDVDCFIKFKYRKYKYDTDRLDDLLEPAIERAFTHYKRLHGSRDYFQAKYGNYMFEFVPVLKVRKPKKAKNITDVSPLHVDWVKKRTKKSKLKRDIRLAKQFFKAAGVYGAESYIRGFSGHVVEILVIHCGGFLKLARASQRWKAKVFVDPEKHWRGRKRALVNINKAKLDSPMLVVDPVQPERNAAAALNKKKFLKLKEHFKKFLKKPSAELFKVKPVTISQLKKNADGRKLILMKAEPQRDKKDIAGAKLLKQFKGINRVLRKHDFEVLEKGWQWKGLGGDAVFWFYLDPKKLSKKKKHYGPPKTAKKERIDGFLKKYGQKARRDAKRLYVEIEREYRRPEKLFKDLLSKEKFENLEIVN